MVARKRDKMLKRVTLTLDPDDYAVIDKLAYRSEVSSSWLIRRAVREFLERHAGEERIAPFPPEG
jgi:predicted transcriptional regulator